MYKCGNCANYAASTCDKCVTVNDGKPSEYVEMSLIEISDTVEDTIRNCLNSNVPIPYKLVYYYNAKFKEG